VKTLAERIVVGSGAAAMGRLRMARRTLILAYHNVLPDASDIAGDLSLHLRRSAFAHQLDHLAEAHDVIPLSSLFDTAGAGNRPRVVITFDDAYAGALSCGLDELQKRGMPATIFVAPGLLGSVTWWDVLAARSGGVMPDNIRHNALTVLGGHPAGILGGDRSQRPTHGSQIPLPEIATESQLSDAAARPGVTIGSHTWSHPNLAVLSTAELATELSRSLDWLVRRFPETVRWMSYPYGLFNEGVARAAAHVGYHAALRIDGGWMPSAPSSRYTLPRLNIPAGLSLDGFRLRLAGLLP
jgi:peptidoglycan/xylan/chitin deacetylase (PgdA/CDA1 family)